MVMVYDRNISFSDAWTKTEKLLYSEAANIKRIFLGRYIIQRRNDVNPMNEHYRLSISSENVMFISDVVLHHLYPRSNHEYANV
jgi:hypothetical protein